VRGVLAAIALCALALSATACGERSEPTGATVSLYPVTVGDAAGVTTKLDAPPRRILAVGGDMAATLRALGAGKQVVATTNGPVGNRRPDLVAVWSSNPEASAIAHDSHVYVASDRTIGDVQRSLADLGVLTGHPLRGSALAGRVDRSVRQARERLQRVKPVSTFLDTGFFTTAPRGSLVDQMITAAGGRNVGATSSANSPVDVSRLRSLDPRYYLATSGSGTTLRSLRRDRATARLSAVRAGRFAVIRSALLQPGPNVGAGVAAIARVLHPNASR
jgi:iron complex transport system substrate-binding protein